MAEFSRHTALRIYELQTHRDSVPIGASSRLTWGLPNPIGATPLRPRSNGAVDESTVLRPKGTSRGAVA